MRSTSGAMASAANHAIRITNRTPPPSSRRNLMKRARPMIARITRPTRQMLPGLKRTSRRVVRVDCPSTMEEYNRI